MLPQQSLSCPQRSYSTVTSAPILMMSMHNRTPKTLTCQASPCPVVRSARGAFTNNVVLLAVEDPAQRCRSSALSLRITERTVNLPWSQARESHGQSKAPASVSQPGPWSHVATYSLTWTA